MSSHAWVTVLISGLLASTANAQGLYGKPMGAPGGHGHGYGHGIGPHSPGDSYGFDSQLLTQAMNLTAQYDFQSAIQKINWLINRSTQMPATHAKGFYTQSLSRALDTLQDFRLSSAQRAAQTHSFLRNASQVLAQISSGGTGGHQQNGNLETAIAQTRQVMQAIEMGDQREALRELGQLRAMIHPYSQDYDILRALEAVNELEKRLRDPYLTFQQKINITKTMLREITESIRRSDACNDDMNGGTGIPAYGAQLGSIGVFTHQEYQKLNLTVNSGEKFREALFQVKGGDLYVEQIKIIFGNGEEQPIFLNHVLRRNEVFRVDLYKQMRMISRVVVTGMAQGYSHYGTRVEVLGVK